MVPAQNSVVNGRTLRTLRRQVTVEFGVTYTHQDPAGMNWRFAGMTAVCALADQVMAECGLISPSVGFIHAKQKPATHLSQRVVRLLIVRARKAAVEEEARRSWTARVTALAA